MIQIYIRSVYLFYNLFSRSWLYISSSDSLRQSDVMSTDKNITDIWGTDSVIYEEHLRSKTLHSISSWYAGVHGYLSLIVCFFGIPTNLINVTVLTRKHMQTPINCILTWMAVSDMLTMGSYVPFVIHFYIQFPNFEISPEKNGYGWMSFLLFHINFSATTHTVSIWLGVALAIFRYRHIQSPAKGSLTRMRRLIRARLAICGIVIMSIVLLIPNYMSNKLVRYDANSSMYGLQDLKLGTSFVRPVVLINLFLYSTVAKLLPCILMLVYGGLLLRTLNNKVRVKRRKLSQQGIIKTRPLDTSRTTIMLLIVMVLFLLTELPQAILIVLSIILKGFFTNVYIPLGDAMDIIALINNAINFILYCSMSREFRRTLVKLVCSVDFKKISSRSIDLHRDSTQSTRVSLI